METEDVGKLLPIEGDCREHPPETNESDHKIKSSTNEKEYRIKSYSPNIEKIRHPFIKEELGPWNWRQKLNWSPSIFGYPTGSQVMFRTYKMLKFYHSSSKKKRTTQCLTHWLQ
ncbi:Hypothetical protein NTJ_12328 [Nesidiocoris tenuis]|uniref:Uncharacterized protein n=1 Tax=Nesidiocoris tenuis TaxID=355587 RepID=A0ABN7B7B1_9HEMI|nr:Hypothetical protein NTJ_12328 [Nesidiocoris tenuis]